MEIAEFDSAEAGVPGRSNEVSITMRKIAIGLAAAAIAVGGSTLSVSAHHGPMGSYKESSGKGSLGKSSKSHITPHRFGRHTYGMEEREYGPRHRYYDRDLERREFERRGFGRHSYEPLLSPFERERLRGRIISRLEREPLLSRGERERLHSRIMSRLEREPLLTRSERERLRSRIAGRLEREEFEERGRYEPRLSQFERERSDRYYRPYRDERERYSYRRPMYGHRYEHPSAYRYGYERPYGHRRYGYERPYGYRYGHERYMHRPEYYGRH
jgi:hypothetical protein